MKNFIKKIVNLIALKQFQQHLVLNYLFVKHFEKKLILFCNFPFWTFTKYYIIDIYQNTLNKTYDYYIQLIMTKPCCLFIIKKQWWDY